MTERPILFKPEMIRAILDGRKTMTRRILKHDGPPDVPPTIKYGPWKETVTPGLWIGCNEEGTTIFAKCPYGTVGDELWGRETFIDLTKTPVMGAGSEKYEGLDVWYKADNKLDKSMEVSGRWKPSIHMPRAFSRIQLKITDIRAERLQEIGEEDIIAEGLYTTLREHEACCHLREQFRDLWDSINSKRGFDWESNPWLWVIEFERIND